MIALENTTAKVFFRAVHWRRGPSAFLGSLSLDELARATLMEYAAEVTGARPRASVSHRSAEPLRRRALTLATRGQLNFVTPARRVLRWSASRLPGPGLP
jgi:hypothetical protein